MQGSRRETFSRLKFITRIQKGQKVRVKDMVLQPEGWLTSIIRTLWPDNRANARFSIEDTVRHCLDILKANVASTDIADRNICRNLIRDLELAKNTGIPNLAYTYRFDEMFACHIQTLIEEIDANLRGLREENAYLTSLPPPPSSSASLASPASLQPRQRPPPATPSSSPSSQSSS